MLSPNHNSINIKSTGFEDIQHSGAVQAIPAITWTKIINDGAGAATDNTYIPEGVEHLYDPVNDLICLHEVDIGHTVLLRFHMTATPTVNNTICKVRLKWVTKDDDGNVTGTLYLTKKLPTLDEGLVAHDLVYTIPLTINNTAQENGDLSFEIYTSNITNINLTGYKIIVMN